MKNQILLYLTIIFVWSFSVTPGFNQSFEELITKGEESYKKRKLDSALVYANKALKKAKAEYAPEDRNYLLSLDFLAWVHSKKGNFRAAETLYLQGLEIIKKVSGDENSDYALWLNNLAATYKEMGLNVAAEPLCRQALEIRKKVLGVDDPGYANSLNNLASLYNEMGNYAEAESLFHQALEIKKKALGVEDPGYAIILNNLANLYLDMGYYAAAEPLYQQALEIRKKALSAEHPLYAQSLNNLASLYDDMGNYAAAESLYKQALEIRKIALSAEHPVYAESLNNLASLYSKIGNYAAAEPLYQQALEIRKKTLGEENAYYANSLHNLASLYQNMGNYAAAEPLFQQALEIKKKALGVEDPRYANSLNSLAMLYFNMDNYAATEPLLKLAMETRKKSLGIEHPDYATSLNNLARLYQQNGQPGRAVQFMLEANPLMLYQLKKSLQFMSEEEAQLYYQSLALDFEMNNSFIASRQKVEPSLATLSLNNELALKGATLQSSIRMRQSVLDSGDSNLINTYSRWRSVKEVLNTQYGMPLAKRYDNMDSLTGLANALEKVLVRGSQAFGNMQTSLDIEWTDIQKGLTGKEASIEYINFRYNSSKQLKDSTQYAALIVRPGYMYPEFIPLFEKKDLFRILYDPDAPVDRQFRRPVTPEIMQQVYELAWKPIEKYLSGVNTVYLSTSGLLTTVPFQALMKDNTTCLIDSMDIHYLLSTRGLAIEKPVNESAEPLTAALFGGIRYDLDTVVMIREARQSAMAAPRSYLPNEGIRSITSFSYLEGSMAEIKQVNSYLTGHDWKTRVFTDSLATEARFKQLDGKNAPTILHIATHGFYFPPDESQQKDRQQFSMGNRFRAADNPLRRTGLIFAGANRAWKNEAVPDGVEDGILTAYEISNMDLRKTSLVVLSACETGLGDIKPGEGVFGLQRAFRLAGVRTIIMSLWRVPDKTTAELMTKYFEYSTGGMERVAAFNKAVNDLRKRYPGEPAKWAAFIIIQ